MNPCRLTVSIVAGDPSPCNLRRIAMMWESMVRGEEPLRTAMRADLVTNWLGCSAILSKIARSVALKPSDCGKSAAMLT